MSSTHESDSTEPAPNLPPEPVGEDIIQEDDQTGSKNTEIVMPGSQEEDNEDDEDDESLDMRWHDFESQYSLALAQSAIVEREKWGSSIEFLMSCISSAVGLGNIWRFPFVAGKNGGGAFFIAYFVVIAAIGRPLYYLELSLGQFASAGPVKIWEMAPLFRGVGYGSAVASFMVITYYCAVMGTTILYLYHSFRNPLPWSNDADGFFEKEIIRSDLVPDSVYEAGGGVGNPSWQLCLCTFIGWLFVWGALVKGISGSGKVAYFTALFPYVVLIMLLVRGLTLPGAMDGVVYFLKPDFTKLASGDTWFAAVNQCFFSLGVGFGGCVMFSSFNMFNHKLGRDVLIISVMDTITSLIAGISIFGILGNLATNFVAQNAVDPDGKILTFNGHMKSLAAGGGKLAFVSYPQALQAFGEYPLPQIFSVLFFVMLLTLGIGSANALAGTVITIISDSFPRIRKWIVVTSVCVCGFLGGIMYSTPKGGRLSDLVDTHGAGFVVYIFAFCEVIGVFYVYGLKNYCNDVEFMLGKKVNLYWIICWGFVLPLSLIVIFIFYCITYTAGVPVSATISGWILSIVILSVPLGFAIHAVLTRKSSKLVKRFKASLYPSPKWGPKDPVIKDAWRRFKNSSPQEFAATKWIKMKLGIPSNYNNGTEFENNDLNSEIQSQSPVPGGKSGSQDHQPLSEIVKIHKNE